MAAKWTNKTLQINKLEKRLMLDASLGALAGTQVFAENTINETPQVIDSDVSISGSTTDFDGETLTISHDGNTDDQLSIHNEGTGAGEISISGSTVSYGGVTIGTVSSDGTNGTDLVIDFTATTSQAALERLIENITYANTSDTPTALRTATLTLTTSSGSATDFSNTVNLAVSPENDAPVVNGTSDFAITDGTSHVLTTSDLDISDGDNTNDELTIIITTTPLYGHLERISNTGVEITSFTYDELIAGDIQYVNDSGEFIQRDNFQFEISDGTDTTDVIDRFETESSNLGASHTYTFDIGSGTNVTDKNNSGIDITLNDATWTSSSGVGDDVAIELSGGTDTGATLDTLTIGGDLSFSIYAKFDTTTSSQTLIDLGNGAGNNNIRLSLQDASTNTMRFVVYDGGTAAYIDVEGAVIDGEWALWTATIASDGTLALYKNGNLLKSENVGATANSVARTSNYLGDSNWTSFQTLDGSISSFSVFESTLNETDVKQLYSGVDITISHSDEAPTTNTNNGVTVSADLSVSIGGDGYGFGSEIDRISESDGATETIQDIIDGQDTILTLTFTTGSNAPTSTPGEVLFESGGAGTGIALILNSDMELEWYQASSSATADITLPDTLSTNTQYSIVIEIDSTSQETRFHIKESDNVDWFRVDRTPEATLTGNIYTDIIGTDDGQVGNSNAAYSIGGYSGTESGTIEFQGTIDSDLVIYSFSNAEYRFGVPLYDLSDGYSSNDDVETDVNGNDTQHTIIVTMPEVAPDSTSVPGQVLFENGGAGRGYSIVLNNNMELEVRYGPAQSNAYITSPDAFQLGETYAIVLELIDSTKTAELHYLEADNFDWYTTSRTADITGVIPSGNISGGDTTSVGNYGGSLGGFTGGTLNDTNFAGTIVDNYKIYTMPASITDINERLVTSDEDTLPANLVYTITSNVSEGTLTREGDVLGLGDTFTQRDLDIGLIRYNNTNAAATSDSFDFTVSDGTTTLSSDTFDITISNTNSAPVLTAGTINIAENTNNGTVIGTIGATDSDTGQTITYSITGGTGVGIFDIDANTGDITVVDNSGFDYETGDGSYTLNITATDNGTGNLSDTETFTFNITNVDEAPSFTSSGSFSINENLSNGSSVGFVSATDPDTVTGDTVSYSITTNAAYYHDIFQVNSSTGEITIKDNSYLNYENETSYTITIRATGSGGASTSTNVTININDIDEAPSLDAIQAVLNLDGELRYNSTNEHFYYFSTYVVNSYADAEAAAASSIINGQAGYLATITSSSENAFIDLYNRGHAYLGGSDSATDGVWIWNGGEEDGIQFSNSSGNAVNGLYENWRTNYPTGSGNYLGIYGPSSSAYDGTWFNSSDASRAFILEYNGSDVINNSAYTIDHASSDASDVQVGDSLGYILGADAEGDTLTYSITGGNGDSIFEIDATSGELRIADISNINTSNTYTLTIRATEDNGSNQYDETTITIDYNRVPGLQVNNDATVLEGGSVTINDTHLEFTDPDNTANEIIYTITSLPTNGEIQQGGVAINTFTQADLNAGNISFVHDGSETTSDSFSFSISDGGTDPTTGTFDIIVTPQNDSVSLDVNTGTTMDEGNTVTITNSLLSASDVDASDTADQISYTITSQTNGTVYLNSSALGISDTFTQDDIDNNRVTFVHDGSETTTANFGFSVADGLENSAVATTATFAITVQPINEGPAITTNTGTTVLEGGTATIDNSMLNGTDPDDSGAGLAWSVSNLQGGYLALSSNTSIPILSFTQAQLDAGALRFVHDGNELDGSFDVSLADGGENGTSPATATFTLTKTDVNDAPVISRNFGTTVDESGTTLLRTAVLNVTDPDDSGAGLTWTISNEVNGQVELISNPNVAISSFTQAQLEANQVIFRHTGVGLTAASFDVELADGGENSAGTDSATVNVTVNNINDQPIIATNTGITLDEGATHTVLTTELDGYDPDDSGTELTWTISNISSHIDVQLSGSSLSNGDTFTQADVTNGFITIIHDGTENFSEGFDVSLADGGEDSTTAVSGSVTVTITPINESPAQVTNTGTNFNEGATQTITSAMLSYSDPDTADTADQLTYTVSNLQNGIIQVSGSTTTTFTQDDIDNNRVTFVHNGSETTTASFDFSLADGLENSVSALTDTFSMTITPVNDAPILTNNGITLDEAATITITTSELTTVDPDATATSLVYTITTTVSNGTLNLSGSSLGNGDTFTQDDIANGRITYVHAGGENISDSFVFSVTDGTVTDAANTFSITVTPVNDAPVEIVNNGGSITEGQSNVTVTQAMLEYTDGDHTAAQLTYTVTAIDNGTLRLNGSVLGLNNTFTQDDINNGLVTYSHNSSETSLGGFDFNLSDGSLGATDQTFSFTVTSVNDAPSLDTNTGLTANEGSSTTLTTSMLDTSDPDNADTALTYTVTSIPANGTLYRDNIALNANDTFTQADIINGLISYIHDGTETISDSFDFNVSDGALSVNGNTFSITITPQNDAAALATNTGTTLNEGATSIITSAMLSATDIDDTDSGLAYTISNLSNGVIQVSGSTTTTFTQDDIDNNRVTFVHDGSETTTAGFDFSIADGLEHGASAVTGSFDISVTPQNDSPTISVNTGATVGERLAVTITSSMLNSADPDDNAQGLTYTASNYSNGWIEVNGTIQHTFTQDDINNNRVVFQHDSSETITASFDISLADGGEHGAGADTDTFSLTVTPRNDPPVITVNTGGTITEGSNLTIINTMLAATDDTSAANDLTWTISQLTGGHFENNISGLVITSFTQADINAGVIDFIHNGSEASQASFSGVLADSGADGVDPVAFTFTLNVTPVNDAPTNITLSRATIPENIAIGGTVALLNTIDPDIPGDIFTYTLMNNPNNMFTINGNQLIMAQSANFNQLPHDTITIRTDDGNGGILDQEFTITFTEVSSPITTQQFFIPLRGDTDENIYRFHAADYHTRNQSVLRDGANDLSLQTGNTGHLLFDTQPVRNDILSELSFIAPAPDNTVTFEIAPTIAINNDVIPHIVDDALNPTETEFSNSPDTRAQEALTLEDALNFFKRVDTVQDYLAEQNEPSQTQDQNPEGNIQENPSLIKRLSVEEQFENIATYQLKRTNALKAALQS